MNILVVEDDAATCYAIRCALEEQGHTVVICENSTAAWGVVRDGFDILVTDIVFPPGQPHGVALTNHARSGNMRFPVIFITGFADYAHDLREKNETVLLKPFEMTELVAAVESRKRAAPVVSCGTARP